MKKIISQWKWDKLFDESQYGLGYHEKNGDWVTEPEELEEWFRRLDELENNYIVFGPRVIINFFRDILRI